MTIWTFNDIFPTLVEFVNELLNNCLVVRTITEILDGLLERLLHPTCMGDVYTTASGIKVHKYSVLCFKNVTSIENKSISGRHNNDNFIYSIRTYFTRILRAVTSKQRQDTQV